MYYLAINELDKEFAIVEKNFAEMIVDIEEEYDCSEIYLRKLHGNANWDKLVEEYGAKGYRYTTIDSFEDAINFVTQ